MPTRSSKPKDHDFTTTARRTVEHFIGEKLTGGPLDEQPVNRRVVEIRTKRVPTKEKNPAAVALGRATIYLPYGTSSI